MKRILLFLLACCPMLLCAQEDNSKYLAGAVPVVNGKVIFTEVIQASDMSKRQISIMAHPTPTGSSSPWAPSATWPRRSSTT